MINDVEVGDYEKREIDAQIERILRDLGNPPPPLKLEDVRKLLKIDLHYYRSTDPGWIEELGHRFRLLAQKTIPDLGKHLAAALRISKLDAFWVPENRRILLDQEVPQPKHRWIESHEIGHSITEWHKNYLLGDNRNTVDPLCRAVIESEANFGAGRLLFMRDQFAREARDLPANFASVKTLAKRYENSIVSTFWRLVESRDPTHPVFGVVSNHPHFPEIGAHDGNTPWRYFIRSPAFRDRFPGVTPEQAFAIVTTHCTNRKTGPLFQATDTLTDGIGEQWDFDVECFSTKHNVLTLGSATRKKSMIVGSSGWAA